MLTALALAATAVVVSGAVAATPQGRWRPLVHAPGIVDVVGPRSDGRLVVSTRNGLFLLQPGGALEPFATGAGGYAPPKAGEPYVALAFDRRLPASNCAFVRDDVFVLDTTSSSSAGVVRVRADGQAQRLLDLPKGAFPSGIAFDHTGRFGYRLLVTGLFGDKTTTLYAIDCAGKSTVLAHDAPRVEGGIVVAPPSFGRFAGDLIGADERSGTILAFGPSGKVRTVAKPPVKAGGDIGVEGLGFVPGTLGPRRAGYVADLGAPGSPTTGSDALLVLRGQDLARAGLRPAELVAITEAGAVTVAVRCAPRCTVRRVALGPVVAHGEGHIAFAASP
jgi:hypothetical protein